MATCNVLRFLLQCLGLRTALRRRVVLETIFILGFGAAALHRLLVSIVFFSKFGYAYTALSVSIAYGVECLNTFSLLLWIRKNQGFLHRNVKWTSPLANNAELLLYGFICFLRTQRIGLMSGRALYALFRRRSVSFYVAEVGSECFAFLPWLLAASLLFKCLKCVDGKLQRINNRVGTSDPKQLLPTIVEVLGFMDECNHTLRNFIMVGYCNQVILFLSELSTYPYTDRIPDYHFKQILARVLTDMVVFTTCSAGNSIEKSLAAFRQKIRLTQLREVRRHRGAEWFLALAEHMGIDTGLGQALSFKMVLGYISFTGSFGWLIIQAVGHIRHVYQSSH